MSGVSGPQGALGVFAAESQRAGARVAAPLAVRELRTDVAVRRRNHLECARRRRVTDIEEVEHQRVAGRRRGHPSQVELRELTAADVGVEAHVGIAGDLDVRRGLASLFGSQREPVVPGALPVGRHFDEVLVSCLRGHRAESRPLPKVGSQRAWRPGNGRSVRLRAERLGEVAVETGIRDRADRLRRPGVAGDRGLQHRVRRGRRRPGCRGTRGLEDVVSGAVEVAGIGRRAAGLADGVSPLNVGGVRGTLGIARDIRERRGAAQVSRPCTCRRLARMPDRTPAARRSRWPRS